MIPTVRYRRGRRYLAVALVLFALALTGCGRYELRSGPLNPPAEFPDFTLTDHNGRPFRLSEQRGKVVLLFFGYASCPDVCPTTLADLASVKRELGADAERLAVAFVTVDPERDTQAALKEYVTKFDPDFVGLRGSQEELDRVIKDYGVTAVHPEEEKPGHVHTVTHSDYVYVIDREGRVRELFDASDKLEDMVSDVRYLINE